MHKYRKYFPFQSIYAVALFCLLHFLSACGTTGLSHPLAAGEPKNSIPFFEKSLVEELHAIAVPPFDGDHQHWHVIASDILSSGKISVISQEKIKMVLRNSPKDLPSLGQEERHVFMTRLGRAVRADAVLNGVFFNNNGQNELILQIVSTKDSRILWWQAVDLKVEPDSVSPSDQRKVLASLLTPLMAELGKKAAANPAPKTEKRPEKDIRPLPLDNDISPM